MVLSSSKTYWALLLHWLLRFLLHSNQVWDNWPLYANNLEIANEWQNLLLGGKATIPAIFSTYSLTSDLLPRNLIFGEYENLNIALKFILYYKLFLKWKLFQKWKYQMNGHLAYSVEKFCKAHQKPSYLVFFKFTWIQNWRIFCLVLITLIKPSRILKYPLYFIYNVVAIHSFIPLFQMFIPHISAFKLWFNLCSIIHCLKSFNLSPSIIFIRLVLYFVEDWVWIHVSFYVGFVN